MKGVLFNVVEEVVTEKFGADTWDDLLEAVGAEGAYTALGDYESSELVAIVGAASQALDTPAEDVLRLVGRAGLAGLAGRYPELIASHRTSRTVLADLNRVIHPQVLAIYPDASVPQFDFHVGDRPDQIELDYRSERGLCHLAEGLIAGLADRYDETIEITQSTCVHRGDDGCRIVVTYADG